MRRPVTITLRSEGSTHPPTVTTSSHLASRDGVLPIPRGVFILWTMSARTFHVQGHRGSKATHDENTLAGFRAAFQAGADSVETDLHLTSDGIPVLIHDPFLTTDHKHVVTSLTYASLRSFTGARMPPKLDDFFAFATSFGGQCILDLELKAYPYRWASNGHSSARLEAAVLDLIRRFNIAGRVAIRSFDHRVVRRMREVEPQLVGVVLLGENSVADPVAVARAAHAQVVAPDYHFVDEDMVKACRTAGVHVLPWTVNDPADWARLADWGVTGVTTDDPGHCVAWKRG